MSDEDRNTGYCATLRFENGAFVVEEKADLSNGETPLPPGKSDESGISPFDEIDGALAEHADMEDPDIGDIQPILRSLADNQKKI